MKNQFTSENLNDGAKQCLDTRCGLEWSGAAGLPALQEASGGADADAMESGRSSVAHVTNGVGGQYSMDLGASLSSFAEVCLKCSYLPD